MVSRVLIVFFLSCGGHAGSGGNVQPIQDIDNQSECMTLCESRLTACTIMGGLGKDNNQCVAEWQQCTALCYARGR